MERIGKVGVKIGVKTKKSVFPNTILFYKRKAGKRERF